MKTYPWILAGLVIASTTLPIQSFATPSNVNNNLENPDIILAKVNNQPIYKRQLEHDIKRELKKFQKLISKEQISSDLKAKVQNKILQQYINAELIHQASKNHPVDNIEEKVAQFSKTAKENKQTIQSETAIKRQIHINEYLAAHDLISPQPSDKEVKAFYDQGKDQFISKQEKVHVQHIFVTKPNKEQINKAKELLDKGLPFEEVAKKYSEDENTKDKGGDLGFIVKNYMPKKVEDIAFSIPKMTLSEIIETEEGYHILQVLEIRPAGTPIPYIEMKDFLTKGLASKTKENKVAAHLKQLKSKATIKLFNTQEETTE